MTTSNAGHRDDIKRNAKSVVDYNKWAKMGDNREFDDRVNARRRAEWEREQEEYTDVGDFEKEYGTIIMPFLVIQLNNDGSLGKIKGHEGRHRSASALRVGNTTVPVALMMKPGEDMLPDVHFGAEYHLTSEHVPSHIEGQYNGQMYPTKDWTIYMDDMQKHVRR